MIRDYHYAMRLPNAHARDVESIQNWIGGTGCIARAESDFLQHPDDLANLTGTLDNAVTYIEILIANIACGLSRYIREVAPTLRCTS